MTPVRGCFKRALMLALPKSGRFYNIAEQVGNPIYKKKNVTSRHLELSIVLLLVIPGHFIFRSETTHFICWVGTEHLYPN